VKVVTFTSSLGESNHGKKIIMRMIKAEISLLGMWNDFETKVHQVVI
jgi:hypothetical protein